jgi:hypothetical protein
MVLPDAGCVAGVAVVWAVAGAGVARIAATRPPARIRAACRIRRGDSTLPNIYV